MAKKLRTRKHKVVLNRSVGGDGAITFFLVIMGACMFLPMVYAISHRIHYGCGYLRKPSPWFYGSVRAFQDQVPRKNHDLPDRTEVPYVYGYRNLYR